MTKVPDSQRRAAAKWDSANLDRIGVALPKGTRERLKAKAAEKGLSVNKFLCELIDKALSE